VQVQFPPELLRWGSGEPAQGSRTAFQKPAENPSDRSSTTSGIATRPPTGYCKPMIEAIRQYNASVGISKQAYPNISSSPPGVRSVPPRIALLPTAYDTSAITCRRAAFPETAQKERRCRRAVYGFSAPSLSLGISHFGSGFHKVPLREISLAVESDKLYTDSSTVKCGSYSIRRPVSRSTCN
jgi:hypothetical protein